MGLDAGKHVFWGLRTTKAQTNLRIRSLISAFFIRLLESIRSRLATSQLSIFYPVSVAEQAGLNFTLTETPNTVFFRVSTHMFDFVLKRSIKSIFFFGKFAMGLQFMVDSCADPESFVRGGPTLTTFLLFLV